jgi:CheY-like chemotaxis protein
MAEPRRVLIVEDEAGVAMVLEELLSSEGYATTHAADAVTGLQLVEAWRPDAILLDLTMPGVDGREFAHRLHAMPDPAAAVPIVVVTGVHGGEEAAASVGAQAVIRKPFSLDLVVETLERVIAEASL